MAKTKTEAPAKNGNGKALATQPSKAITTTGSKIAGKGFENLEREDILLPRLKLLQPLSPEVADQGEKPGTMFINLSNKNIGKDVLVVPVLHFRSRIKWNPKDDGGGIDCSSPDAKVPRDQTKYAHECSSCPHREWTTDGKTDKGEAPLCTLYENFVILIDGESTPILLPMSITKAKVAKKWYSTMALKGGDMFSYSYKLSVVQEKNPKGQPYFNFQVTDMAKKTSDQQRAEADRIWESLQHATIATETEAPDEPVTEVETATTGQGKF